MFVREISKITIAALLSGAMLIIPALPVAAERELEWRGDGLWVISDGEEIYFEPLAEVAETFWAPRVATMSHDGNWIAFARHTGGGFENEGQSCFLARWDGSDERLLLETDRLIPAIYWLEGDGSDYVAVQQVSGGTLYGSYFSVVDPETCEVKAQVGGMIYSTCTYGPRYVPTFLDSIVGLRYEVPGRNETPTGWGIFSVDELITFPAAEGVASVDGEDPAQHPLTDGHTRTAWIAPTADQPQVEIVIDEGAEISGLCLQAGWQWHQSPAPDEFAWQGTDWYRMYDRPREIVVVFEDGSTLEVELEDTRSVQWVSFGESITGGSIILKVVSVFRGLEFDQVAISDLHTF